MYYLSIRNIRLLKEVSSYDRDGSGLSDAMNQHEWLCGDATFEIPFCRVEDPRRRRGVSTAYVSLHLRDAEGPSSDILFNCNEDFGQKIPRLRASIYLAPDLFDALKSFAAQACTVNISFDVESWESDHEESGDLGFSDAKGIIRSLFLVNSQPTSATLSEYEAVDIRNHLLLKNCPCSISGQVADICTELSNSFSSLPCHVDKSDLIHSVDSLIRSLRWTLHQHLSATDKKKVDELNEKYGYEFNPYLEDMSSDLSKISDSRDQHTASKIFNHLWTPSRAEDIFSEGFPLGLDSIVGLAEEYLNLKYLKSETLEVILVDLMICGTIADKASFFQSNKLISQGSLLSVRSGIYNKHKRFDGIKTRELFLLGSTVLLFGLTGKILAGLLIWWLSVAIAGSNETAQIVLFGTLFAAHLITVHLYYQSEGDAFDIGNVSCKRDEMSFNTLRDLSALRNLSDSYKSSSFRALLNKCVSEGTLFPRAIHLIVR